MSPEYIARLPARVCAYLEERVRESPGEQWRSLLVLAVEFRELVAELRDRDVRVDARALRSRLDALGPSGCVIEEVGVALDVLSRDANDHPLDR